MIVINDFIKYSSISESLEGESILYSCKWTQPIISWGVKNNVMQSTIWEEVTAE